MSDFAKDFRDFSLSIWTFRADLDCSSSNALSLRATFARDRVEYVLTVRRRDEVAIGVVLDAVKYLDWLRG